METKQDFLDGLRRALTGKISHAEVEEHVRYYDDYITAESRMQGGEKAVLDSLGKPELIAMSICAAGAADDKNKGADGAYGGREDFYKEKEAYSGYDEAGASEKDERPFVFRHPKLTVAFIVIGLFLVAVLFVALAFSLLKLLWPVIVTIIMVILVVRLIVYIRDSFR